MGKLFTTIHTIWSQRRWKWQIGQYDEGRVAVAVAEEETKVAEEDKDSEPSSEEEEEDD